MSGITDKAAAVAGPLQYQATADSPSITGVYAGATSSANASIAMPVHPIPVRGSTWSGKYLRIRAITTDLRYNFSRGAQTLVYAQASTIASPSAARGATLAAGEWIDVLVPRGVTHLNYITASAAGEIEYYCSEAGAVQ